MEIPSFLIVPQEMVEYFKQSFDYGGFYGRNDAAKMTRMYTPNASSMSPKFQYGGWDIPNTNPNMVAPQTNYPQIQIDPAQNTAPVTTDAISPKGQGGFNGSSTNTLNLPPTESLNKTTPETNLSPSREIYKNVVVGLNKVVDSGLDLLTQQSEFNPNSQTNAVLDFQKAQNNPTNYLNKVGVTRGITYAKNGGRLPLKFRKPQKSSYNEGDELDLTTEEIHKLEQQGYKFQTL